MTCRFDQLVIIGCGKIAATVLKYVLSLRETYGYGVTFIQHEVNRTISVNKICREYEIECVVLQDDKKLATMLENFQERTLIISAGNYFIFPQSLLQKENIMVINFHNALLPKYPGRNAPSWAIYYDEKESGATWHRVTPVVDSGDIIVQKSCKITEDMKAYELTAKIMELAQLGLEEFFEDLLKGEVPARKQLPERKRRMFYAKDIPGNGCVKVTDEPFYIYRTLRALDYGKMGPFPATKIETLSGNKVEIIRYKKISSEDAGELSDNRIEIPLDDTAVLSIIYK